MTTFFTSDTHFNHSNIIKYCNRPWLSVDDMNMGLIERWNSTVAPQDTVYHLGDFALGKQEDAPAIFELLNGEKYLISGNHDGTKVKKMAWASVEPFGYLPGGEDPMAIMMIHNPGAVLQRMAGRVILHGHLHGQSELHPFTKLPHTKYIDVGVDCWDYRPVTLDQLLAA